MTHKTSIDLTNCFMVRWCCLTYQSVFCHNLNGITQKLEAISENIFIILVDTNPFNLKFRTLKRVAENERKFGLLSLLHVVL